MSVRSHFTMTYKASQIHLFIISNVFMGQVQRAAIYIKLTLVLDHFHIRNLKKFWKSKERIVGFKCCLYTVCQK